MAMPTYLSQNHDTFEKLDQYIISQIGLEHSHSILMPDVDVCSAMGQTSFIESLKDSGKFTASHMPYGRFAAILRAMLAIEPFGMPDTDTLH